MIGLLIILAIVVIFVLAWVSAYNGLIKMRNWVEESWAQIDVQLKRRYDLIPNLVETVKGYAKHEEETLTKVVELRNKMGDSTLSRQDTMEVNDQLSGALKSMFALREAYPDLKANENFKMLQEELTQTENKIAYSRQLYNNTVMKYNTKIESIPTNIIAGIHNFEKRDMLEAKAEERENVRVSF
ncbi:LemA family protein [Salisediminibacterium selenitireducens]|uniref:LemA family protein n=1 Tax=Bacillus selenitireducens (strain ATCC 700615 / DSM 15326 / MLS10) TaxID=439292 RepID=D6XX93_BACIE|nr:LemA family protein [Salisediminibacterium selenitireducens]ADH97950.1 LemA family protein [[Bacillus] selenitireducens MLS10]